MTVRKPRAGLLAGALATAASIAIAVPMMATTAYGAAASGRPVLKEAYTGTIDSLNPFIAIYQNSDNIFNLGTHWSTG